LDASLLVCGGFNGKEFPHCPCAGRKQTERTSLLIWWRGREFKRFRLYVRAKKDKNDEEKCA
jgi:hypothetical protein